MQVTSFFLSVILENVGGTLPLSKNVWLNAKNLLCEKGYYSETKKGFKLKFWYDNFKTGSNTVLKFKLRIV